MDAPAPSRKFENRWAAYYHAVSDRPPRPTLLTALEKFDTELGTHASTPGLAVDLGCGNGRDTVELLRRNWRVLAIDGEPDAIAALRQRQVINRHHLNLRIQRFEDLTLPPKVDLINASFCLPFCPPAQFPDLWEAIVDALRSGGRFCGHLFGDRDAWSIYNDITFHTLQHVNQLLEPFDLEVFEEEEHPGQTALGEEKHWHLYNIVACKR
ncbi:MAG: class I SAM-dependent methyltransferase [Cyanobacteria bacterium P01_C01_bin.73]